MIGCTIVKKTKAGPVEVPSVLPVECSSGVLEKGGRGLDWMQVDGWRHLVATHLHPPQLSLRCIGTPSPTPPAQPQTFPNRELFERSLIKDNGQRDTKTWWSVWRRCCPLAGWCSESAGRPEWHSAEYTAASSACLSCVASATTLIPPRLGHQRGFSQDQLLRHFCDQWNF